MEENERARLSSLGELVFDQWARRNQNPDLAWSHIKYSEKILSAGMVIEVDGQFYEIFEEDGKLISRELPL